MGEVTNATIAIIQKITLFWNIRHRLVRYYWNGHRKYIRVINLETCTVWACRCSTGQWPWSLTSAMVRHFNWREMAPMNLHVQFFQIGKEDDVYKLAMNVWNAHWCCFSTGKVLLHMQVITHFIFGCPASPTFELDLFLLLGHGSDHGNKLLLRIVRCRCSNFPLDALNLRICGTCGALDWVPFKRLNETVIGHTCSPQCYTCKGLILRRKSHIVNPLKLNYTSKEGFSFCGGKSTDGLC